MPNKEQYQKRKEYYREYNKKKYHENKENNKDKNKTYYQRNKERIKKRVNEYSKTDKYNINNLRRMGWKHSDDYLIKILRKFEETDKCELCNCLMVTGHRAGNRKVKDHHHSSGCFRNICCNNCNYGC